MKIPRIFGVVVFLHVLVITIVLVQPGCRTKNSPAPADTADSTPAMSSNDDLDPVLADEFNPVSGPASWSPSPAPAPAASGGRQPPTRPTVQLTPGGRPTTSPTPAPTPVAPAATHTVVRGDSLWKIAQRYSVTVGELMEANNLNRSSTIQPGQQLLIPARASDGTAVPVAAPAPATAPAPTIAPPAGTYTVRGGDTLSAIAARHGTTVAALRQANRLTSDIIRAGQVLTLPGPGGNAPMPPAPAIAAPETPGGATHTVSPGETPGAIARRYGVSVEALMRANNIDDPRRMRAGQVLMIPGGTAPAPVARPATPSPTYTPPPPPASTPLTPAELEAQLGTMSDADLLPVEDAPLTPVPPSNP